MADPKRRVRATSAHAPPAKTEGEWLTRFAFYLALALVCARATMLETLRDPVIPSPGAEAAAQNPGPAATLLLNWLFCLPALLVLLRRTIDPHYVVRWSWMHEVMAVLALWMALSELWAADRFSAIVNASTFVSCLVLMWAMIQLVRSPLRLRFVAGAAFGLLLVYVASGIHYRLVELPELQKDWEINREQHLRSQGIEPGSFQARQFEQKVLRGDVGRFSNSPNSYAAAVVLLGLVSIGAVIQRVVHRDSPAWLAPIIISLLGAAYVIYHTHSRVAMITPVLAATIFALVAFAGVRLSTHAKKLYWAGVSLFLLGVIAIAAHGRYHGGLPDKSMTFRWYYWTGAAKILAEHPILGVGWSNFGQHYSAVRVPAATEQVKDPHNLFVRFFVELGVIGGILVIAWMLRLWWELLIGGSRHVGSASADAVQRAPASAEADPTKTRARPLLNATGFALAAGALNILFAIDWAQSAAYITVQLWERLIGTGLLLIGLLVVVFKSFKDESLDDRPADWLLTGIILAVAIFLLHNLIDFSLFETAPLSIFAMLTGSALGMTHPTLAGKRRKPLVVTAALTAAALLWILFGALLVAAVAGAESEARRADEALRTHRPAEAVRRYLLAREAFPANADYAFRAAHALVYDSAPPEEVAGLLDLAISANPRDLRFYVFRANYLRRQSQPDTAAVRADFEKALSLDPRDVGLRLEFAEALAALNDKPGAIAQYREALQQDNLLPQDEPKRLPDARRGEIETRVAELGK